MILAALVVLTLGQAEQPATVTYTNPGARIEVILPELSKLTGLTLRAAPEIAGRALILRLDHAPVQKVLDRIAHATYGQWGSDHGAYILYRDAGRIATEMEAAKQAHISDVAKALPRIGTKPKPKPKKDGSSDDLAEGLEETPTTRALHDLVPAFDPTVLGTIPGDSQLVYSTRPTPLQIGLPNGSEAIFERLLAELRALPAPSEDGQDPPGVAGESSQAGDLTGNLSKGDVDVSQNGNGELAFTIKLYDDKGKLMFTGQVSKEVGNDDDATPTDADSSAVDPSPDGSTPTPAAKPKQTSLELSPIVKDFLRANAGMAPITPALRERLLDPLAYDPDSFMGEVYVACAVAKRWQLVASPADYLSLPGAFSDVHKAPTVENIASFLESGSGPSDGWIELSDTISYPEDSAGEHIDRHAIARALKAIPTNDGLTLMDEVRARRAGVADLSFLPQEWLCEKLISAISRSQMLTLLSTLDDEEIDLLLSGKTLYLGSVSPSFQAAFSQYSASSNLAPFLLNADGSAPPANDPFAQPPAEPPKPARSDDLWQEFTELCDTYAPPPMAIRLTSMNTKSLTVIAPPGAPRNAGRQLYGDRFDVFVDSQTVNADGSTTMVTITSNAPPATFSTSPGMPEFGVASERLDGLKSGQTFRLGTNQTYTLLMNYAPFVCCQETASTTTFDANSKAVSMDGLPSDMQKSIRHYLQQQAQWQQYFKQAVQDHTGTNGGGGP